MHLLLSVNNVSTKLLSYWKCNERIFNVFERKIAKHGSMEWKENLRVLIIRVINASLREKEKEE